MTRISDKIKCIGKDKMTQMNISFHTGMLFSTIKKSKLKYIKVIVNGFHRETSSTPCAQFFLLTDWLIIKQKYDGYIENTESLPI